MWRSTKALLFSVTSAFAPWAVADDLPPGALVFEIKPFEASGVAALPPGPDAYAPFAVVGDNSHKKGRLLPTRGRWRLSQATDGPDPAEGPEGVDVALSDTGEIIWLVLGEDNRTLSTRDGRNFKLPASFEEICQRGPEGLSVRWHNGAWDILVLWEGGYYEFKKCDDEEPIPTEDSKAPRVARYTWELGAEAPVLTDEFDLQVPSLPGTQKFRAPDLAWHPTEDAIAVLLASTGPNGKSPFAHTWLQLFGLDGAASPKAPMKLEGDDAWGDFEKLNWEGLDYTWDGTQMVMVNDNDDKEEWLVIFPAPF